MSDEQFIQSLMQHDELVEALGTAAYKSKIMSCILKRITLYNKLAMEHTGDTKEVYLSIAAVLSNLLDEIRMIK